MLTNILFIIIRHLILASGAEGIEGFRRRWSLHGRMTDTKYCKHTLSYRIAIFIIHIITNMLHATSWTHKHYRKLLLRFWLTVFTSLGDCFIPCIWWTLCLLVSLKPRFFFSFHGCDRKRLESLKQGMENRKKEAHDQPAKPSTGKRWFLWWSFCHFTRACSRMNHTF